MLNTGLFIVFRHGCLNARTPTVLFLKLVRILFGPADSDSPGFVIVVQITMLLTILDRAFILNGQALQWS